ncbi:adenosylmethionine--8-amino-7-oxononanoate transaminase [Candidatus Purcelliella pentastirinorum]|uniref:Adenosylmethionine-8-amino-7-oxononanoate aminotransferase n=1 Tax=Candidatus Purcelliella pentastirinorum TaxID=472834 RepID=A0AAX3N8P1_9ENTR|nr:adenosylmethionine--8-amino-7-oxononanoate transaminase [Candidatus Purcelliella pentastirinorum]WDI78472.1 adenosylmethionine--8-amino-7-oxononanoate transaminase [Candidatus Purcelliella pentastirinorum]
MKSFYLNFDKKHIWHPYTSMINPFPCYLVDYAYDVYIKLYKGNKLIDGMSSWWGAIHGYNNKFLNDVLKDQIDKISHVMFGGITHIPAIKFCEKLLEFLPYELQCIFLSDTGSVSIEVALKMSLQYWQALGEKRYNFISIRRSYHGDTFAAMSVSDPNNSMHKIYGNFLSSQLFIDEFKCGFYGKWKEKYFDKIDIFLSKYHSIISAIILEPIVQAIGGMNFYHPNYLYKLKLLCNKYQILLICDEIATGFGRTGRFFAFEYSKIVPDILCIGKAITGGTMTLAATITSRRVADVIGNGKVGCFMHGPTFMGNPLACSVAYASLKLLCINDWKLQVFNISIWMKIGLFSLINHPDILDVRVLGAIGVVEFKYKINIPYAQKLFVQNGVWVRPFEKIIYLVPPYIISEECIIKLCHSIHFILSKFDIFIYD